MAPYQAPSALLLALVDKFLHHIRHVEALAALYRRILGQGLQMLVHQFAHGLDHVITSYSIHYTKLYENISGAGAGVENIKAGEGAFSIAWIRGDADDLEANIPDGVRDDLNINYLDLRYAGIKPWDGAWGEVGITYAMPNATDAQKEYGGLYDARITSYNVCYTKLLRAAGPRGGLLLSRSTGPPSALTRRPPS